MKNKIEIINNNFLLYKSSNNEIKIDVYLYNETIWLNQNQIAELFSVQRPAITKHLKNIFLNKELNEKEVSSILEHATKHGAISNKTQIKKVIYYNLDAIIAVGYRVNSKKATQFRIWATKILKEYIIKGFAMNDEKLKNPNNIFGKDYFDEQLERIRDIRSSERRFYQKITDIYSQCSIDYDNKSQITQDFFKKIQNKLHYAIHKNTAPELIYKRANSKNNNMGLTNWKNFPNGKIRKYDVIIAKNYLNEKELKSLNKIVSIYLDLAEERAERKITMTMQDWIKRLDAFLKFDEREILKNAGDISQKIAKEFAEFEFEKYRMTQDKLFESDFDKLIKDINNK